MMKRTLIALAMTLSVAAPAMADKLWQSPRTACPATPSTKEGSGPCIQDVAKSMLAKDAEATLITQVTKGQQRAFGVPMPMPANTRSTTPKPKLVAWFCR